jgi:predicted nucleotidyltransferase
LPQRIPYCREEIFGIIKSIKEKLEAFKIVEVQVFGSYARDEANAYSDLDIVVVTRQSVIDSDYLFNLQIVLEEALKIPLDLHLFQNQIDYSGFDRKMCADMVKIL